MVVSTNSVPDDDCIDSDEEGMIKCRDLIELFFSEPQLMNDLK